MEKGKKITRKYIVSGLQILAGLILKYKREMVIFSVLSIILAIGNALIPYIVGLFIDSLVDPSRRVTVHNTSLPLYTGVLTLWTIIQVTIVLIDRYIARNSDTLGGKVWTDYVADSISHLLRLPLSFHKKNKIGEVFDKINLTANNIEAITTSIVIQLSPQLLSVSIAIGITFYINSTLGYFLLSAILIFLVIFIYGIGPLAELQKKSFFESSRIWGNIYDNITNARQIKEAAAEDVVSKVSEHGLKDILLATWSTRFKLQGSLLFYQRTVVLITQLIIFVYSIFAVQKGIISVGELLAVNGYAQMVFGPFVIIGRNWQNIQNGVININETEKILQLPEEKYTPDNQTALEKINGDVSFDHVDFYYQEEKPILSNITFDVAQGETVALVGESGVGKSTLVDLLLAFHFPKQGSVKIDGIDIQRINLATLRKNIAVVSQDIVLFNDTIFKNIAFSKPDASKEEVEEATKIAHAYDFIEKFPNQWDQVVGERGIRLSGGQRQRVALARAVLADPSILILDEPTSALDARSEMYIQESLKKVMEGKTTFIIAHRFSMVRNAHKIIVLKHGSIVEIGSHNELMNIEDGEYRHLYSLQTGQHIKSS